MKKTLALLAAFALTAGASFAQTAPVAQTAVKTTGSDANQNALHQNLGAKAAGKGNAQGGKHHKSPAQKADHKAAKMAKELGLNADQEAKVEQVLLAENTEMQALHAKAADTHGMTPEMKAARDKYDGQLKAVLTPEQFAKLQAKRAEHHNHDKESGKMKGKAKA